MANVNSLSPITYYGGKTSILPTIIEMIPIHIGYTELFAGGLQVFFNKTPSKVETINDRLDIVVNFYRVLKHNFKSLNRAIDASLISRTIHNEAVNIVRAHRYGVKVDKIDLAWAFWLCSNFSFMHKIGGGYKQQKGGGKSIAMELRNKKKLFTTHLQERIENATIENEHWLKVGNARNAKEAFHYLDPSYPGTDQGAHFKFTWNDLEEMFQWCGTECIGKFMISNYPSPLLDKYVKLYGWNKKLITHELKQARNGETTKTEVILTNYVPHGTIELFK